MMSLSVSSGAEHAQRWPNKPAMIDSLTDATLSYLELIVRCVEPPLGCCATVRVVLTAGPTPGVSW